MCVLPKAPKLPPAVERQAAQMPQIDAQGRSSRRRRGLWASIMTGPKGLTAAPAVTGTPGGVTGA